MCDNHWRRRHPDPGGQRSGRQEYPSFGSKPGPFGIFNQISSQDEIEEAIALIENRFELERRMMIRGTGFIRETRISRYCAK